ncbi:MAG TPA: GNAT family N-acetyltransferase [Acidobacteriaceae bacterium]|jgi:predicted GNAT family acetyltransferase|nr:GNAT family N-acetyltransferase [Acidobacteriaceae bacterium]
MSKEDKVTRSRFEIEERGEVAYLEFDTDSQGWMTIWHTEVPPAMRGKGVASELAQSAFEYAKQNHLLVDVICPLAAEFLSKHPEYDSNVGKKADR